MSNHPIFLKLMNLLPNLLCHIQFFLSVLCWYHGERSLLIHPVFSLRTELGWYRGTWQPLAEHKWRQHRIFRDQIGTHYSISTKQKGAHILRTSDFGRLDLTQWCTLDFWSSNFGLWITEYTVFNTDCCVVS